VCLLGSWSVWNTGGKTTSEYLETPRGQSGRYSWRKDHGLQRFTFDSEPKSKKGMSRQEKLSFQKQIYVDMRQRRRRAYRGRVCAQFSLEPTEDNPPHIQTAVKNLVDLFGRPLEGSGIRSKGLVYGDDSQIAYLAATYSLGNKKPNIRTRFYPFGYFLMDLELASNILAGTYEDDHLSYERRTNRWTDDEMDDFDDLASGFSGLTKDREAIVRLLGKEAYNAMRQYYMVECQERWLRLMGLRIRDLHLLYRSFKLRQEGIRLEHISQWARSVSKSLGRLVIESPLKINLPRLPMSKGETSEFKSAIRHQLCAFRARQPMLQRLYWPVGLELLYKPPLTSRGFQKDLDNIVKLIVPVFNEEFKPPPSLFSPSDIPDSLDGKIRERLRSMVKSVQYSIVKYEVFEIPRTARDDEEGFLCLGVTGGTECCRTMWDKVEDVINAWKEQVAGF
jgi:hypothetical protein